MWSHLLRLLGRSFSSFTGALGNTNLGFIVPFLVPVLVVVIYGGVAYWRQGWPALVEHIWKTLSIAAVVAIAAEVVVYGPIFMWAVVKEIYSDHTALVGALGENHTLKNEHEQDKGEISDLKSRMEQVTFALRQEQQKNTDLQARFAVSKVPQMVPAHPARDPNGLYQFGNLIGTVQGAVVTPEHSAATFQFIRLSTAPDPTREIEYQDWTLICDGLPPPKQGFVGTTSIVIMGLTCRIIGRRA
jgi:hypothetical protein